MTVSPDVSVVLAVYNGRARVEQTLERVRALRVEDLEIVLVDDGSTDGTLEELHRAAESDARVRVIAISPNGGLGSARRAGFSAARGRYVWNIDIDDEWPEDALARLLAASGGDADLVLAAAVRRKSSGDVAIPAPAAEVLDGAGAFRLLLTGEVTGHLWNKFVSSRLLSDDVYTDARLHSDLTMCAPLLARAGTVRVEHHSVYTYVEHEGSSIRSTRPRGDSLGAARAAVRAAAAGLPPERIPEGLLRRFEQKFLVLSELRDAVRANYDDADRRRRFAAARQRISVRGIGSLFVAGSAKDAALLAAALIAPPAFRRVMRR